MQLCREFHCLPSVLRAERYSDVMAIIAMLNVEEQVRQLRKRANK